jgi:polyribonucleotide nucleotidyltransferase
MDFKVAGSGMGITALQMDIKVKGVTRDLLERALEQAKQGRVHILKKMLEAVAGPRGEVSEFAPRSIALKIPAEKIGFLIGPGGKNIKALQADYEVKVTIVDDDGNVQIFGVDSAKVKACRDQIKGSTQNPEIGDRFTGTVRSIRDFGAFIEILPGVEGLCHVSELDTGYVSEVSDVISMGDEVEVEVINVDDRGKVKVSRKAVMIANGATPEEGDGPNHEERGDRPSGGRGGRDRESVPRGGGRGRGQRDD